MRGAFHWLKREPDAGSPSGSRLRKMREILILPFIPPEAAKALFSGGFLTKEIPRAAARSRPPHGRFLFLA